MGLYDPPKQQNLIEDYPPGSPMYLEDAVYEGVKETSFGMQHQASILVSPPDDAKQSTYRVWGVLAEQIRDMDDDDTPAMVCVQKEGRKNVWKLLAKGEGKPSTGSATVAEDNPF